VAELLELVDAAFDEVSLLVFALGERDLLGPVGFRWDHGRAVLILDHVPDPVGVVAFVGENAGALGKVPQEKLRHRSVMDLTG
jgi:hypothetical protein